MEKKVLKIGTRGSKLALWQAQHVQAQLEAAHQGLATEIVIIRTSGDWSPSDGEKALNADRGGKALFAKEIEEALLAGRIDLAVHSLKDMDSQLPAGLGLLCCLAREDARDAALFRDRSWAQLYSRPQNWPVRATVGTVSPRRQGQLLQLNGELALVPLRGNVGTRISKLRGDMAADFPYLDATILAAAGLKRLGQEHEIDQILSLEDSVPAACQGIIALEGLIDNQNWDWPALLAPLNCRQTALCAIAERSVLQAINAGCHTAIGIHARYLDDAQTMQLHARYFVSKHVKEVILDAAVTSEEDAALLGAQAGQQLLG